MFDIRKAGDRGFADHGWRLRLIVSPDGRDGSVTLHQDGYVYAGLFDGDERTEHPLDAGRRAYIHVVSGDITVNGQPLSAGDAAKLEDVSTVIVHDATAAEVLVFDLP